MHTHETACKIYAYLYLILYLLSAETETETETEAAILTIHNQMSTKLASRHQYTYTVLYKVKYRVLQSRALKQFLM